MGEAYFSLKRKLEELGYNNTLPIDAVPLVECILADLLQTTRSLQHYMDLSREALQQRDSLMLEAEPYKCDNAKLIQENNQLNKEIIHLKEENMKMSKESKRKIKALSEELMKKDTTISKLQHDLRDLSLRGICAETLSSRNKSKRKEAGDTYSKVCVCNDRKFYNVETDVSEVQKKINVLEEKNEEYIDEIALLKNQIEHRDNEIVRLNILLEGGRPLNAMSKDCCNVNSDSRVQNLMKQIHELENANDILKKEISSGLEKQHEAMLRALGLADKNKALQEEVQKVDTLALKVEEDCNKRLASMMNEVNFLQTRIEGLIMKNSQLEKELTQNNSKESLNSPKHYQCNELLKVALKEKDTLQQEIKDLVDLNKGLQDKILALSQLSKTCGQVSSECEHSKVYKKCPTKHELQLLLESERKKYERHMVEIQDKLSETINLFNKHLHKCKDKDSSRFNFSSFSTHGSIFVRDLQNKLCEKEQKLLMLLKENEDLRLKMTQNEEGNKQNYKDVISQLNAENSELSKENIMLSQQLSQCRDINSAKLNANSEFGKRDAQKLKEKIEELTHEAQLLKKDKHEYNLKYKEAMDMVDKLKRDLAYKQKDMELLQEENSSYKMSHRTGKASADHLKDECNFLREQMKKMQSDVIKEKTLANQIKNIQLETERSSNEIQNELLVVQKKLSLSNDNIDSLERKCKELQSEIGSLQNDKSKLVDNIKKLDQDRDKLVLELDNKAETISVLEQKLKSQTYEMGKLDHEISDLKRRLNVNKFSEHKLVDNETQIAFLNGEILRLTQQLDNAIVENKHLQNNLADVNGTMKLTKIEYEKSRKEVDGLKQQLQHYVAEIRRIEELLSQKEAERSDMLEQFASLSVEANILENTNHSLESESASKSLQLQSYVSKIQSLEEKILDKENIIDSQSARLATMTCRVTALENEVKLLTDEKAILEQNITCLKQMCSNIQSEHTNMTRSMGDTDSELKLYENKIKSLTNNKTKLQVEKEELNEKLLITEKLLSNARKEIVELKLALQDATSETKSLQQRVSRLSTQHADDHEATLTKELELQLPLMLEETIHEVSHEEDEDSSRFREIHKRYSKYSHSSTL
ncbi:centrosomal protein of 135 kDa-like [Plodia interpunctella]|uniref:centrosomal protein of 135 kDa-like n=1 Tax=Plodia interpunctella TaxID=58824 RepID=UPI0023676D63|nr:centrosomal protein of 135 kDa-like [Plodia interpunctella]